MLIHATEKEMRLIEAEFLHHKQSGGIIEVEVIPDDEETPESWDYEATTLLHLAAKYGNIKATQFLVDSGYNVDITNPFGCTPLMIAIHFGESEVVRVLLDANTDIFLPNHIGMCAAKLALLKPKNLVLPVLEKIKSTCRNDSRETAKKLLEIECPLARATFLKDTSVVNYMLDNGRAVDELDNLFSYRTALHYAVRFEDLSMVKLLLDRGINVNVLDAHGLTPLLYYNTTSEDTHEKLEILKTILDKGATITVPETPGGVIPGELLLRRGKKDSVRILLRHVSDIYSKNNKGVPLLHLLMNNCSPGIIELWKNKHWNFHLLDDAGRTALFIAAVGGSTEATEVLIKSGVDVNAVTLRGNTVLFCLSACLLKYMTITRNHLKCVEIFLRYGVDAQRIIREKFTILDSFFGYKNFPLTKIILAHFALMEEIGQPIKELLVAKIKSDIRLQKYFSLCKKWLNKMKKTVICGSLTLFKLLTENEETMRVHARNPRLVAHLEHIMYTQRRSTMYYCNILRRRIKIVIKNAELKKLVRIFVSASYELYDNDYLIEKIVEFII